jgi:hypothetical protein
MNLKLRIKQLEKLRESKDKIKITSISGFVKHFNTIKLRGLNPANLNIVYSPEMLKFINEANQ